MSLIIDSLDFARRRRRLAGALELATLLRLRDALFDTGGHLRFELRGETVEDKAFLCLDIDAVLHLCCQRCLSGIAYPLESRSRLMLVPPGQAWPDETLEDDSYDAIEANRQLDVACLVEDELILGLPQAPRHEACRILSDAGGGDRAMPFAILAGLKTARK